MSDSILVLHPVDAASSLPDLEMLVNSLLKIGLIASKMGADLKFEQGKRFFELVNFFKENIDHVLEVSKLGRLVATKSVLSRTSCFIEINGMSETEEFLGGGNISPPLCHHCQFEIVDWPELMSEWYANKETHVWTCPQCVTPQKIYEMNWRYTNGFSRYSIYVWHIQYDEAVPSLELMDALYLITGQKWTFFYLRV